MTRYEQRGAVVMARLPYVEKAALDERAAALGVSTSTLIRGLVGIATRPEEGISGEAIPESVSLDRDSLGRLTNAINTYGSLLNQATKSLNTIAKHGARNAGSMESILGHVSLSLKSVAGGCLELDEDCRELLSKEFIYLESADGRSASPRSGSSRYCVKKVRLSESEKRALAGKAEALGLTLNALVRAFANVEFSCDPGTPNSYVVFDRGAVMRLFHSANTYGSLIDQADFAMGKIEKLFGDKFPNAISEAKADLEAVSAGTLLLENSVTRILDAATSIADRSEGVLA